MTATCQQMSLIVSGKTNIMLQSVFTLHWKFFWFFTVFTTPELLQMASYNANVDRSWSVRLTSNNLFAICCCKMLEIRDPNI